MATDLAMQANLVAGVIPGHKSAVVPRAGVMGRWWSLPKMGADEVVDACSAALVGIRQSRQQFQVVSFHAAGLSCEPHLLQALVDAVRAAFEK